MISILYNYPLLYTLQHMTMPTRIEALAPPAKERGAECCLLLADRLFFVCARADGLPPEGRCDFFVWDDKRERGLPSKRARK